MNLGIQINLEIKQGISNMRKYSFLTEGPIAGALIGGLSGMIGGAYIGTKLNSKELYHYILNEIEKNPGRKNQFANEAIATLSAEIRKIQKCLDDDINMLKSSGITDDEIREEYYDDDSYSLIEYYRQKLNEIKVAIHMSNQSFAKAMVKCSEYVKELKNKQRVIMMKHKGRDATLLQGGTVLGAGLGTYIGAKGLKKLIPVIKRVRR